MKENKTGLMYIALTALVFSTAEVSLKMTNAYFGPLQITMLRYLVGGIMLIPIARAALRRKGVKLALSDLWYFAMIGVLFIVIGMGCLYQGALILSPAGVVSAIFCGNPLFVAVLAPLMLREKVSRNTIIALILEIIGIVIIINPFDTHLDATGALMSVAAAVSFALYAVLGKRKTAKYGGVVVTCCCTILGSLILLALILLGRTPAGAALFRGVGLTLFINEPVLGGISWASLPALLYVCLVGAGLGFMFHMKAVETNSVSKTGLIFLLKLILAPLIALWLLQEPLTANMLLGLVFFVAGSLVSLLPGLIGERKQEQQHA